MTQSTKLHSGRFSFCAYTWALAWLVIQYTFSFRNLGGMPREEVVPWESLIHTAPLLAPAAAFSIIVILLYLLFGWLNVDAFKTILLPRLVSARSRWVALFTQLLLSTLTALLINAWFYPATLSGQVFVGAVSDFPARGWSTLIVLLTLGYYLCWIVLRFVGLGKLARAASAMGVSLLLVGVALPVDVTKKRRISNAKPNVIVIGLDSLRPDHIHRFGGPLQITPNLDHWLQSSLVFSDTLSPQPHTFPATVSILTGQWPKHHGARANLISPANFDPTSSLAKSFSKSGYQTVFAMDETRFANIDARFGFQRVVGPPMGIMDFLMSGVGDNVLSNLVANLPFAAPVFPYVQGNRGVSTLYQPAAFDRKLAAALEQTDGRPLFLYVHYCIAHWPYRNKNRLDPQDYSTAHAPGFSDTRPAYLRALRELDGQFGALVQKLKNGGFLEDAIVVVLSDHGEDFNMEKDRITDDHGQEAANTVYGHGGSAIRAPQVNTLLSFRRFGGTAYPHAASGVPASLIDVAPTLSALSDTNPASGTYDGIDLSSNEWRPSVDPMRIRFVESSFLPMSLNQRNINEAEVAAEAAGMYEIVPNGRLQVRREYVNFQIAKRQRAAFQGNWLVATLPTSTQPAIVVNRVEKRWWMFDDAPRTAPVSALRDALCTHWASDSDFDPPICSSAKKPANITNLGQ